VATSNAGSHTSSENTADETRIVSMILDSKGGAQLAPGQGLVPPPSGPPACDGRCHRSRTGGLRTGPGRLGWSAQRGAHSNQRRSSSASTSALAGGGRLWDTGRRPADRVQVGHLQAELGGQGGIAAVVVAALAAGVADRAGMGEAVGGLVQQGAEDVDGAALEASPLTSTSARSVGWSVSCQRPAAK
jgi:hypothetical protein